MVANGSMCCHRPARCLSISGLVLVTYGHSITGNDVCLCWKQQSNVFEFEDSGNLTFKVFCTRISRKDGLISILLAPLEENFQAFLTDVKVPSGFADND